MCGRSALYSDFPKLSASLKLPLAEPDQPLTRRYNIAAPGTFITAVRRVDDEALLLMGEL